MSRKVGLGVRSPGLVKAGSALLLTVVAGIVRVWNAALVPGFRVDEVMENIIAVHILHGRFPLTNHARFMGAFYNYLLALVFKIFGPSIEVARLVMVVSGTLTVTVTFLLAYDMFGWETAFVSALLLSLAPGHILVASHVAWSASLTPLFVVLTLFFFYRAVELGMQRAWFWAGLSVGLALQTHPVSAVGVVLTPIIYLIATRKVSSVLKSRGFALAVAGFILGYCNMIVYNIVHPAGSLLAMSQAGWAGVAQPLSLQVYLSRLQFTLVEFATLLCAGVPIVTAEFLVRTPLFYIYLLAIFLSLVLAVWRRGRFLLLVPVVVWGFAVLPVVRIALFLGLWDFAWGPHYLQMLLPPTFIMVAHLLYSIWDYRSDTGSRLPERRRWDLTGMAGRLAAVLLLLLMLFWPLQNLVGFYGFCETQLLTNQPIIDTVQYIRSQVAPDASLYIDHYAFQSKVLTSVAQLELPPIRFFTPSTRMEVWEEGPELLISFLSYPHHGPALLVFSPPGLAEEPERSSADLNLKILLSNRPDIIPARTIFGLGGTHVYYIYLL